MYTNIPTLNLMHDFSLYFMKVYGQKYHLFKANLLGNFFYTTLPPKSLKWHRRIKKINNNKPRVYQLYGGKRIWYLWQFFKKGIVSRCIEMNNIFAPDISPVKLQTYDKRLFKFQVENEYAWFLHNKLLKSDNC